MNKLITGENGVKVSEEILNNVDWDIVALKVTNYSLWKLRKRRWRTGNPGIIAKSQSAEDIATDSIGRFLAGQRTWNQDKYPDIIDFFYSVADSIISDLVKSPDNTRPPDLEIDKLETINTPTQQRFQKNPEEIFIEKEQAKALIDNLIDLSEGDEKLEEFILCFTDGIETNEEICQEMEIDKNKVYSLRRKLKRRFCRKSNP